MEQVQLGKSGIRVSRIGLGMWQAGGNPWGDDVNDEDSIAAMVRAHELGVNLIDTAEVYGNGHSEEVIGRALKEIGRDEMVLATKVSPTHARYEHVLKACDRSLRRLGVDEIDLYQLHAPAYFNQVPLSQTMGAMEKLHKNGKIRAVAVSNFAVGPLKEARAALSTTDIVSNQVQFSMLEREIEREVLPYCQREGISVLAWSPLGKGMLTGKYNKDHKPQDPLRKDSFLYKDGNLESIGKLLGVLADVAKADGKTPAQVALNWLLSREGVIPIPGAKRPSHVEMNAGAAGWDLSKDELVRLDEAAEAVRIDPF